MPEPRWSLQDAKNSFSTVGDAAAAGRPQTVTKRGKPTVVVLSVQEYEHLNQRYTGEMPSFVDHLLAMPQDGADLLIAATSLEYDLTVVTRNVRYFEPTGVGVVDPFTIG